MGIIAGKMLCPFFKTDDRVIETWTGLITPLTPALTLRGLRQKSVAMPIRKPLYE
jgi:hypothetical protein